MTKEIIAETEIPREKGYLFVCGTNDKGNLTINQFPISYRKERKRKNKIQRQSRNRS